MDLFIFTTLSTVISVSNNGDPDQTPHLAVAELGQHCLHNNLKRISGLNMVKFNIPYLLYKKARVYPFQIFANI